MGQHIIEAIRESLENQESGKIVRPKVDVLEIRKKLKMSQQKFASEYHINLETLRNWEQGKRSPDMTALTYLTCIAKKPDVIRKVLQS